MRISVVPALMFLLVSTVSADPLSFGGPPFPESMNLLTAENPLARVARDSLLTTLTAKSPNHESSSIPYSLLLSDSLKADQDGRLWSFRLKDGSRFSNGAAVTGHDLIWSLERCKIEGDLSGVESITLAMPGKHPSDETWIALTLKEAGNKIFPLELAKCPVFEKASASVFSDSLGAGSNLISAGNFRIKELRPGRSITLARSRPQTSGTKVIQEIELRGIVDDEVGLSSLRSGQIVLYFTENEGIIKKAESDTTLKAGRCQGYNWVARKGVSVDCATTFSVDTLTYD